MTLDVRDLPFALEQRMTASQDLLLHFIPSQNMLVPPGGALRTPFAITSVAKADALKDYAAARLKTSLELQIL
jgi:hypothetical protein